jgi:molybdopterin-guanine dinucleotide biosynthesis protein A
MGSSKPLLAWHGSTLVRRVAGIVARGVSGPVLLVRSPGQWLPSLPDAFEVLDDLEEGRGPLGGLGVGLEALATRSEVAYVSSTDVPFLHPAFVRRVVSELSGGTDACIPCVGGRRQPLAASYRVSLAPLVQSLLASDRLRLSSLLEACHWRELDEAALLADPDLARFDPGLESVTNLNGPREYRAATVHPPPTVHVQWLGGGFPSGTPAPSATPAPSGTPERARISAPSAAPGRVTVRAATLGAAAEAIDVRLGSHLVASLNGDPMRQDPEEPLAEGDVVSLVRAETGP